MRNLRGKATAEEFCKAVANTLKDSATLDVSEDGASVRRNTPMPTDFDSTQCSIHAVRMPPLPLFFFGPWPLFWPRGHRSNIESSLVSPRYARRAVEPFANGDAGPADGVLRHVRHGAERAHAPHAARLRKRQGPQIQGTTPEVFYNPRTFRLLPIPSKNM